MQFLGFRDVTARAENQIGKKLEIDMEAGLYIGVCVPDRRMSSTGGFREPSVP